MKKTSTIPPTRYASITPNPAGTPVQAKGVTPRHSPPPTRYGGATAQSKPAASAGTVPVHPPPPTRFGAGTAQAKPMAQAAGRHAPPPTRFPATMGTVQRATMGGGSGSGSDDDYDDPQPWLKFQKGKEEKKQQEKEKKWEKEARRLEVARTLASRPKKALGEINKFERCAIVALAALTGKSRDAALDALHEGASSLSVDELLDYCDDNVVDQVYATEGNATKLAVPGGTTLDQFMDSQGVGTYAVSIVISSDVSHIFVVRKTAGGVAVTADSENKAYASYKDETLHSAYKKN